MSSTQPASSSHQETRVPPALPMGAQVLQIHRYSARKEQSSPSAESVAAIAEKTRQVVKKTEMGPRSTSSFELLGGEDLPPVHHRIVAVSSRLEISSHPEDGDRESGGDDPASRDSLTRPGLERAFGKVDPASREALTRPAFGRGFGKSASFPDEERSSDVGDFEAVDFPSEPQFGGPFHPKKSSKLLEEGSEETPSGSSGPSHKFLTLESRESCQ